MAASKPKKAPGGTERRGSPVFRARAQEAYEKLKTLIADHGASDIAKDLEGKSTVEDVMRAQPEMVGALLNSAWQLRSHSDVSQYFQNAEVDGAVVSQYRDPIRPCGRTFEDTVQAHLFGAARLYMKLREAEWMRARLAQPEKLGKEFTGGVGNALRRPMGMKLKVDEAALRQTYPGQGLYETLKPFLLDEGQFKLVTAYAELSTKGASIIGDIFENLRSTSAIRTACVLDPDTLMNARSCAVAYAETEIFEDEIDAEGEARKRKVTELRRDKEFTEKAKKRAAEVFADILNNHVESIGFVEQHKAGAEAVVRALAPLFKEDTWSVLAEAGAVENVINCPPTVKSFLGRDSRYVGVNTSKFINQLQYPDIGRDIIKILQAELDDKTLVCRALSEEDSVKVWETVPGMFNNQMKYQHDAKGTDTTIKNFKDLKTSSLSLVKEFKKALGLERDEGDESDSSEG